MGRKKRYREDGQYVGDAKIERKEAKTENKTSRLDAKANLALAKSQKRKWLAILIGVILAAYLIIKGGAGSGILEKIPFLGGN
tara:strand:- start:923 stop:1171 length:249 start_codon:yes stop_codon:yes gene_type:complete